MVRFFYGLHFLTILSFLRLTAKLTAVLRLPVNTIKTLIFSTDPENDLIYLPTYYLNLEPIGTILTGPKFLLIGEI